jgi:uncharacterized membrane protein YdjX (TVP38/TMEM64 family)
MNHKRLLILATVLIVAFAIVVLDLHKFLTLASLKQQHDVLHHHITQNYFLSGLVFLSLYIFVTALSIPGAIILTLAGGALFGLLWGTILVSLSSTLGATLAFVIARTFFGEKVRTKFSTRFSKVSKGFEKDGAFFLFSLRLVPVIPFFLINILMAITPIKWFQFLLVSMLGMFPATVVFVNAGTQLAEVRQVDDILSAQLLIAFTMIALLPWVAKLVVKFSRGMRQ